MMTADGLRIGICGLGTVGSGVVMIIMTDFTRRIRRFHAEYVL